MAEFHPNVFKSHKVFCVIKDLVLVQIQTFSLMVNLLKSLPFSLWLSYMRTSLTIFVFGQIWKPFQFWSQKNESHSYFLAKLIANQRWTLRRLQGIQGNPCKMLSCYFPWPGVAPGLAPGTAALLDSNE